jgi:hypothetical protein
MSFFEINVYFKKSYTVLSKEPCPIFEDELEFALIVGLFRRVFLMQGLRFEFNLNGRDCYGRPFTGKRSQRIQA